MEQLTELQMLRIQYGAPALRIVGISLLAKNMLIWLFFGGVE